MNKITHEKYLSNLLSKGIKIVPLEKYINAKTKILHKCTCGNKWLTTPSNVVKNRGCGCKPSKTIITHDNYINKLKYKNIKVMPLDKYQGSKVKILHKCTCGNKWMINPNNVLSGQTCGCAYKSNIIERYKGRKTILYYIKVNDKYKIGITLFDRRYSTVESNIIGKRFANDIKNNNVIIKILKTKVFNNGLEAYVTEQLILEKYKEYKNNSDMQWFGGYTELFEKDINVNF